VAAAAYYHRIIGRLRIGRAPLFLPAYMAGKGIAGQREGGEMLHLRNSFFSEEKKQKTFIPAPAAGSRPWPRTWVQRGNKSFLVLFFKKEHPYFPFQTGERFSANARAPSS
jgi:hypothetical protein